MSQGNLLHEYSNFTKEWIFTIDLKPKGSVGGASLSTFAALVQSTNADASRHSFHFIKDTTTLLYRYSADGTIFQETYTSPMQLTLDVVVNIRLEQKYDALNDQYENILFLDGNQVKQFVNTFAESSSVMITQIWASTAWPYVSNAEVMINFMQGKIFIYLFFWFICLFNTWPLTSFYKRCFKKTKKRYQSTSQKKTKTIGQTFINFTYKIAVGRPKRKKTVVVKPKKKQNHVCFNFQFLSV